mgnify:CR=1 FL=1
MGGGSHKNPIGIFATDYKNYDISYQCSDYWGMFKMENLAITSRHQTMSLEIQGDVREVIESKLPHYDLDNADMYWTVQGNWCQYDWQFKHPQQK